MFWKVFCILSVLSQWRLCYEIEEFEPEVPYEYIFSSEFEQELALEHSKIVETFESDYNLIDPEEIQADDDYDEGDDEDEDVSNEEFLAEDVINFAGPVKAKGTVSVAATFGYDAPANFPTSVSPSWRPHTIPQKSFSSTPHSASPVPVTLPYIPFLSMFLPGIGKSLLPEKAMENLHKHAAVQKPSKEIYLELTLLNNVDERKENISVESNPEDILTDPIEHIDEDFTKDAVENARKVATDDVTMQDSELTDGNVFSKYDAVKGAGKIGKTDDATMSDSELAAGGVFSGLVSASGTVTIAARY